MNEIKVIILLLFLLISTSCSTKELPQFNDEDIKFNLINTRDDFGNLDYDIEVQNTGKLKISFLKLYIDYPIKIENGSKSNPFKVEGKTDENPIILEMNEKTTFHVYAPIKDVFGSNTLLNFDDPGIRFEGYVLEGDQAIPFTIVGGLDVIIKDY